MDRLFIRLVVTIYLLVFAVTIVAAVLVSRAYAGPVTPPRPAPGHFAGKFELVPLFKDCTPPPAQPRGKLDAGAPKPKPPPAGAKCPIIVNGHSYYAIRDDLKFTTAAGDTVTMFAGSRTDLASTPSAVWATMPPDGAWAEAAVAHDNCYRTHGTYQFYSHAGRTRTAPYARAECDEILRQGMVTLGVPAWKRIAIFEAVRAFGGKGWGS